MKAFIKASIGVILVNDLILGFVFYLIFMMKPASLTEEDYVSAILSPPGVHDLLLFILAISLVQMALALLLALPLFLMVRKYTYFSWGFSVATGGFIAYLCYFVLTLSDERFQLSLFLGCLGLGLLSGVVFAFFYSLFNRQAKDIQRR